jgi:hypothetical protein
LYFGAEEKTVFDKNEGCAVSQRYAWAEPKKVNLPAIPFSNFVKDTLVAFGVIESAPL